MFFIGFDIFTSTPFKNTLESMILMLSQSKRILKSTFKRTEATLPKGAFLLATITSVFCS